MYITAFAFDFHFINASHCKSINFLKPFTQVPIKPHFVRVAKFTLNEQNSIQLRVDNLPGVAINVGKSFH